MKLNYFVISAILICWIFIAGCEQPFDQGSLPNSMSHVVIGDTNYVELYPAWTGFQSPRAVVVGLDQLVYVADYGANEIIMLNEGGQVLKRRSILHPVSIAQDYKLNLLVGAEEIAPNGVDTIGVIYRISLVRFDTTYFAGDSIRYTAFGNDTIPIYRDTSYFAYHNLDTAHMHVVWEEAAHPARRFPGIGVLPGNAYMAARYGPDNSSFIDPDTRVLEFTEGDTMYSPEPDLTTRASGGTSITDIRTLTGYMVVPGTRDFVITQRTEPTDFVAYGVTWMQYVVQVNFQGYLPRFDPSNPGQENLDFVRPYRFRRASATAYDSKGRNLFVVDADLDSVFVFSSIGQLRPTSFGYWETKTTVTPGFQNPSGIAYSSNLVLYIADTGNKMIRLFKLSTQL